MANQTVKPRTEIGRQMEKVRQERNLTREDIPAELGISKPTYLNLLRGQLPGTPTIRKISKWIGVEPGTVFEWVLSDSDMPDYLSGRHHQVFAKSFQHLPRQATAA